MMRLEEKREDAVPWETEGRGVSGLMGRLVPHLSGLWSRVSMMGPKSELDPDAQPASGATDDHAQLSVDDKSGGSC